MKNIFLLSIAAIMMIGCKKVSPLEKADELVFGNFYNFCVGDCFKAYGLNNQRLQKDTTTHYLYNYQNYAFIGHINMADSLHEQLSHLLNEIPTELTTIEDKVYGCPDCHDQGGVYVEINRNGEKRRFSIDNDSTNDQSQELLVFKQKIRDAVTLINQ